MENKFLENTSKTPVKTKDEESIGALLFYSEFDDPNEWKQLILSYMPELDFRVYPEVGEPADIRYVLAWKPYEGFFDAFPNLSLVINLGAGVDSLVQRSDLPQVPIVRLSDSGMIKLMCGYVLFAVLRYARDIPSFEAAKKRKEWHYIHPRPLHRIKVGVIGLGQLGSSVAIALENAGFDVRGWDAETKEIKNVTTFAAEDFNSFLSDLDICVNMLPLTPTTKGFLGEDFFARLPQGASFVNASRGAVIDEEALLKALKSGHLSGATLDAFCTEPLPSEHPFWALENVLITPHLASITVPETAAMNVVENIRRVNLGQSPLQQINMEKGF